MPVILILLVLAAPLTVVVTRQLGRATTAAAGFAAGLVAGAGLLFDQPAWQPGTAVLGPAFLAWVRSGDGPRLSGLASWPPIAGGGRWTRTSAR